MLINKIFRLTVLLAMIAAPITPGRVVAECFAGSTPNWNDVTTIELVRCQATNLDYPCYRATFAPSAQGIEGYLVAYRFHGRSGRYSVQGTPRGNEWARMI